MHLLAVMCESGEVITRLLKVMPSINGSHVYRIIGEIPEWTASWFILEHPTEWQNWEGHLK